MEGQPLKFPRLNLAPALARSFGISVNGSAPDDWLERHNDKFVMLPPVGMRAFLSYTRYKIRNGSQHSIVAFVTQQPDEQAKVGVLIVYFLGSGPLKGTPKSTMKEAEFLDIVGQLGPFATGLHTSMDFSFPEIEEEDLWFPLPTWVADSDADEGFELQGITGTKFKSRERREAEYIFSLRQSGDRGIGLKLTFNVDAAFSVDVLRQAFARGRAIARQVVFVEGVQR